MPMYDFVCTACGNKFEDLVFGDEVPACPKCNSPATEKQMCVPSPLKTGAFPYKPGPVRPMGKGMPPPARLAAAVADAAEIPAVHRHNTLILKIKNAYPQRRAKGICCIRKPLALH